MVPMRQSHLSSNSPNAIVARDDAGRNAPTSGSAYNFISITFGEVFAYITGWNLAIELTVGGAAVARGFTSYLATLFGLKPDAKTFFLRFCCGVR